MRRRITETMWRKYSIIIIMAVLLQAPAAISADTEFSPYNSYIYNNKSQAVSVPNPYLPDKMILASASGIKELAQPEDLFVWENKRIFVSDTGNNRIVIFNKDFVVSEIIDEVMVNGIPQELNGPNGLFVTDSGEIYVCDTGNSRILVLDETGRALKVIGRPVSKDYPQDAGFDVVKVVVDGSGNVYAIVKGIYQGAVVFDKDGDFDGFFGAANVESTLQIVSQAFFKKFMTKEQRKKIAKYVPTEFINADIFDDFIYTCTNDTNLFKLIRKFNPAGKNIANNRKIFGDLNIIWDSTTNTSLSSQFIDICVDTNSFSYALDNTYGKVFIYDENFNLLFIFGIKATAVGTVQFPAGIDKIDDTLLVLDKGKNCIFTYRPTDFFGYVENADLLYNNGQYEKAMTPWSEVLQHCSNYEQAYDGIGRALYTQNDYRGAMEYYMKADNPIDYSDAFRYYRANVIRSHFSWVMLGFILLFILISLAAANFRKLLQRLKGTAVRWIPTKYYTYVKYPVYAMFHPIEGFEEMRANENSSYVVSLVVLGVWFLSQLMKDKASGFIFRNNAGTADMLFVKTIVLFLLWVISNWGLRTFLAGRGNLRDIVAGSAYSLLPYTIFSFLYVIASHFLVSEERMFLSILLDIGLLWSLFMILSAMHGIHEYELGRTVISLVLTVVGILLIIFLAILFFSSLQQVFDLIITVFNEIKYRA